MSGLQMLFFTGWLYTVVIWICCQERCLGCSWDSAFYQHWWLKASYLSFGTYMQTFLVLCVSTGTIVVLTPISQLPWWPIMYGLHWWKMILLLWREKQSLREELWYVILLRNMLREVIGFKHCPKIKKNIEGTIKNLAGIVYIKYQLDFSALSYI